MIDGPEMVASRDWTSISSRFASLQDRVSSLLGHDTGPVPLRPLIPTAAAIIMASSSMRTPRGPHPILDAAAQAEDRGRSDVVGRQGAAAVYGVPLDVRYGFIHQATANGGDRLDDGGWTRVSREGWWASRMAVGNVLADGFDGRVVSPGHAGSPLSTRPIIMRTPLNLLDPVLIFA